MDNDNQDAKEALAHIRDIALDLYPFPPGSTADSRYVMGLAMIAGIATEALTAVHNDRPFRPTLGKGDK